MHVSNLYTPAVSGHTLVAAVLFVPVVALYGRIVAARPRTHAPHSRSITGPIHLHLILKKKISADLSVINISNGYFLYPDEGLSH